MKKNTSNEYDLQSYYNGSSYIGIITDISQVFLAIYDTTVSPYSYTGSENIDITDNTIPLSCPLKVNDEVVLNPRNYDGAVFDMIPGIDNSIFLQHNSRGNTDRSILLIYKIMYMPW